MLRKGTVLLRLMNQRERRRVEATGPLTQIVSGAEPSSYQNWQLDENRYQLVKKQPEKIEKLRKVYKNRLKLSINHIL